MVSPVDLIGFDVTLPLNIIIRIAVRENTHAFNNDDAHHPQPAYTTEHRYITHLHSVANHPYAIPPMVKDHPFTPLRIDLIDSRFQQTRPLLTDPCVNTWFDNETSPLCEEDPVLELEHPRQLWACVIAAAAERIHNTKS